MFTLDILTSNMEKFKKLLNKSNVTCRSQAKDETTTTVTFKNQEQLEKAQEIANSL